VLGVLLLMVGFKLVVLQHVAGTLYSPAVPVVVGRGSSWWREGVPLCGWCCSGPAINCAIP
jgi:hypothetical protein